MTLYTVLRTAEVSCGKRGIMQYRIFKIIEGKIIVCRYIIIYNDRIRTARTAATAYKE